MPEQNVQVTQADREAAADIWFGMVEATDENFAVGHHIRTGKADQNELVQAFASHRTRAEPDLVEVLRTNLQAQMDAATDEDFNLPSSVHREAGRVWLEGWFDLRAALSRADGEVA